MSELLCVCRLNPPETLQLSDCVTDHEIVGPSPIDEFEQGLLALNKTAGLIAGSEHPDVIAQMLIVSVVSTTESYFRHLLGSLAATCPIVAANVGATQISYNAVRSYPQPVSSLALLEGVLFSSSGVLAKELKRFTHYEVSREGDLAAAIASFDVVCRIRHAAAHWRGFLDSRAVSELGIQRVDVRNYRLDLSFDLVQRAFAVCDYLVRLVNDVMFRHITRKWLEAQIIGLDDESKSLDLQQCGVLLRLFGSTAYCEANDITAESLLEALIGPDQNVSETPPEAGLTGNDRQL